MPAYFVGMRRYALILLILLLHVGAVFAGTGKIIKVLPYFLDEKGMQVLMLAWRIETIGSPACLREQPLPEPGPGEARIQIAACGLNFADLLMAAGKYQERPALPFTPGLEFAGTVDALGPGTIGPAIGTRVATFAGSGGLAQAACVPANRLLVIPDQMSFSDAAAFQIAYGTAHLALEHKARLTSGETLLVTGAAGGVGLTAVEIASQVESM